jgi:hypothetical protein
MDPRFFRRYLDVLNEGPPAGVGPNAPIKPATPTPPTPLPAPTQAQADKLNANLGAATDKMIQGGEKMGQGNYASGAMTAASAANDVANAAGMTTGDKVRAVGMGVKAATAAGVAHLRGKDPVAAATGSLGKNVSQPVADMTNASDFTQARLKAAAANVDPNADMATRQMAADVNAGKISADSMKGYANRMNTKFDQMSSGNTNADAFDDSPYIQHSGLKTASTAELDPMKKQAVTGQLKPIEYTPAPIQEDELVRLRELLKR